MNVGFDQTYAQINQTGIGSYVRSLYETFLSLDFEEKIQFFCLDWLQKTTKNKFSKKVGAFYRDLLWSQFIFPAAAKNKGVDLLHIPASVAPIITQFPYVITIYDLFLFDFPGTMTSWQKIFFRNLLPISAKKAKKVITISNFSKNKIIQSFHVPESSVEVTYLAANKVYQPVSLTKIKEIKEKYNLSKFVFAVGSLEAHKNLQAVFKAVAKLKQKGVKIQFVHAGPLGWHRENIRNQVIDLGIQDQVQFLGYIPTEDLVALYNAATIFAFMSLYEGFGLPVLEAMACGCPVISSNAASLPEVTGDAGVLVNPHDVNELAQAIERVYFDRAFADDLRQRGFEQSKLFSWEKCAKETLAVYQSALKGS